MGEERNTVAVIEKMGLSGRFTRISYCGRACTEFLTGKKLPAIEALELSKRKFGQGAISFFSLHGLRPAVWERVLIERIVRKGISSRGVGPEGGSAPSRLHVADRFGIF